MPDKVNVLFLATNPMDSSKLRLEGDPRGHAKIRAAEFRDSFELLSEWAVSPLGLFQNMNEVQLHIVHFSGHGARKRSYSSKRTTATPPPCPVGPPGSPSSFPAL